jgi:hypothetical protein
MSKSANLIGDFRCVTPIRNLCCCFQRLVNRHQREAIAVHLKACQSVFCAEIFCQSHAAAKSVLAQLVLALRGADISAALPNNRQRVAHR